MITYAEGFIHDPDIWFDRLWNELNWEKRPDAPRREYWTNPYERPYTYGRGAGERTYQSQDSHELIDLGRNLIKSIHGVYLAGCFLNGYETARDWLGWHADDDPNIDHSKPIAIITVGQSRAIQFRHVITPADKDRKGEYGPVSEQMLDSGSLCLMDAGMQFTHQHRIPKAGIVVQPRISLTYRGLIP